jgi:hypothetical protein
MADPRRERLARNEANFREHNERAEHGPFPREEGDAPRAFFCECSDSECTRVVMLAHAEYEHVRSDPRWFFTLPGHELPEVERVVETHERYVVVEKFEDVAHVVEPDARTA